MGDWRKYFRAPFGGWAHPDAPGGGLGSGFSRAPRNEHWNAAHVPHPDSRAGRTFDWSALERIDLDDRVRAVAEALDLARKHAPAAIAEATGVEFGIILDGLLPGLMMCLCLVAATTALGAAGGAAIGALAMGICRFVKGWSDRPTSLAISPFAIYEHFGRKLAANEHEAGAILRGLGGLLAETGLSAAGIGFADTSALFHQLRDIQHDEAYLTDYVRAIDAASWDTKLSRPVGTLIPSALALDAIPGDLPLRYFDTRYVRYVFAARVERLIIAHSQRDPAAASMATGPLGRALAKLNNFKRGRLQGLGDIDIVQICDLSRQFQVPTGRILLGQTVDKKLWAALTHTSTFSYGARLHTPVDERSVRKFVDFMFSNPYVEEDKRAQRIEQLTLDFCESLFDACDVALGRRPRGSYRV